MQGLTVRQAVNAYLKHREQSHHKLPANSVTDYQRVRDDWGDLPSGAIAQRGRGQLHRPDAGYATSSSDAHKPADEAACTVAQRYANSFMPSRKPWRERQNKGLELNKFLFDFEKGIVPSARGAPRERDCTQEEESAVCGWTRTG